MKEHGVAVLKDLAAKFNLSFTAFGESITGDAPAYGSLALSDAWGTALEPAPVTPTGADAAPFQLLSGTIKSTYNAHRGLAEDGIAVVPSLVSGNTGASRWVWPSILLTSAGRHTVLLEAYAPYLPIHTLQRWQRKRFGWCAHGERR